ncbi:Ribonuclease H-like superfamily [Arabidopsis suecica]|uniref:Ribonuclease H-like superfamily n=1 Tax=Arabidopsis suecica TaxID=45249 RepID=A0A8T1ZVH9_ARASU|nr:Ribonuclease H-like superfamily [Arabidopsis suecica]
MEQQERELTSALPEVGRPPQGTPDPASTSTRPSSATFLESTPRTHLDFTGIEVTPRTNRQVAFAHVLNRPALVPSSLGNSSTGAEVRIAPAFPRLPSPPLLPRGYSPPKYTWIRNQTPASSSHNPRNLPYPRNSMDNIQNGSANPQTPSNNNRCGILPIRSSNQTIDPRSIDDIETFCNYAAQTNANMAQMHSKVHMVVNYAPDIDRVIEETRRTPFTDRIAHFRIRDTGKLRFPEYDGTTDPKAHLRAFRLAITRAYLTDVESEAGHCRFFAENLIGHALEWTSEADLSNLTQLQSEPLRSYIEKFKTTKSKIANVNEEVALAALRNGLWFSSRFHEELTVIRPSISQEPRRKPRTWSLNSKNPRDRVPHSLGPRNPSKGADQAVPTPPPAPKKKATPFPLRLPKLCRNVSEQLSPRRVDFIMGGTIQLPTIARGVRKLTNFIVVDKVAPFNAILGQPWLHAMKAVPSTYHQCLKFPSNKGVATVASNNESEYEALLAGMRLALGMGIEEIKAHSDSQLVTSQFHEEYEAKDERMEGISRGENTSADALAALASTSDPFVKRVIPVEGIENASIDIATKHADTIPSATSNFTRVTRRTAVAVAASATTAEQNEAPKEPENESPEEPEDLIPLDPEPYANWRIPIMEYIEHGTVPPNKWEAKKLKAQSARYCVMERKLIKRSISGPYMTCVYGQQTRDLITSMHEGQCGNCAAHSAKCDKCQRHAPTIHQPTEELSSISSAHPFIKWSMDVVGPLESYGGAKRLQYLLVLTDYFTKWIEAKAYQQITGQQVEDFLWENIICRHGLPYEIVTDNRTNLTSAKVQAFYDKWKIRLTTSTPCYPQGNGQAKAANKTRLSNIKKRLDSRKSLWSDKLPGVLWAHRTTPQKSTKETPFSLAYGLEAVIPAETSVPSVRRTTCPNNPELND